MLNRNFLLLLSGNVILGSAMPMLIILGGLGGAWLAPTPWLATAPPSVQMLAGILVAAPISGFMGRFGRRAGFLLGAGALICGAGLAVLALLTHSFVLLCLAHMLLGAALICVNYFRFAAAETVAEPQRPQAISLTLASGLVAALVGPQLFAWSSDALAPMPLAGAYAAMMGLGVLGAVPVMGLRIPINRPDSAAAQTGSLRALLAGNPRLIAAIGLAALTQMMMVLLMTPTPLAMIGCGFADTQAADVIRWHVVAMFAPGFFTGRLITRFGAGRVAGTGIALLVLSALVAWSGLGLDRFYGALVLLGVGWNFGFVSATHLLQSAAQVQDRARIQGVNDTVLALSSTVASLMSGVAYAGLGWLGLAALSVPVLLLGAGALLRLQARAVP